MPRDLDAAVREHRNLRARLLDAFPELSEDVSALADTLEGISDLDQQCLAVLRAAIEREAHAKALGELIDGMTARKRRLAEGAQAMRLAVLHAMQEVGLRKIAGADMSASIGAGKPKLLVIDEALIPDEYVKITREARKADIAKVLASGQDVPGVAFGNPAPFLSIHRG